MASLDKTLLETTLWLPGNGGCRVCDTIQSGKMLLVRRMGMPYYRINTMLTIWNPLHLTTIRHLFCRKVFWNFGSRDKIITEPAIEGSPAGEYGSQSELKHSPSLSGTSCDAHTISSSSFENLLVFGFWSFSTTPTTTHSPEPFHDPFKEALSRWLSRTTVRPFFLYFSR